MRISDWSADLCSSDLFILIVNGQREEILPRLHILGRGDGAKDDGFAQGCQYGAVGLTGDAAGFERQGLSAPLDFYLFHVEHLFFLLARGPLRRAAYKPSLCPVSLGAYDPIGRRRIETARSPKRPRWGRAHADGS